MKQSQPTLPRYWMTAAALASVLALGACASSKGAPPVADLAAARSAITQAESAGAPQAAPVELLAAREKLSRAEAAVREEKFDQARRLAVQAGADAELAERKTRAAKAQNNAKEMVKSNAVLEQEIAPRK